MRSTAATSRAPGIPGTSTATPRTPAPKSSKAPHRSTATSPSPPPKPRRPARAYAGTVTIKPLKIVGANDNAKPYSIIWNIGTVKVFGIGIKSGNFLFVSSGAGPDVMIAKYKIDNGSMSSDWFKLGAKEMGGAAATMMN